MSKKIKGKKFTLNIKVEVTDGHHPDLQHVAPFDLNPEQVEIHITYDEGLAKVNGEVHKVYYDVLKDYTITDIIRMNIINRLRDS